MLLAAVLHLPSPHRSLSLGTTKTHHFNTTILRPSLGCIIRHNRPYRAMDNRLHVLRCNVEVLREIGFNALDLPF
jgi:hypothetical protein